jgi:hypothetical protein
MIWSGTKDLKEQLARLWERGELLRDAVTGNTRFPLRLTFRTPGSADITERFDAVRAWAAELSAASVPRLEWQEVRHRVQGTQRLPASAWILAGWASVVSGSASRRSLPISGRFIQPCCRGSKSARCKPWNCLTIGPGCWL